MGEREAIMMAAADAVTAWRGLDSVSRRYVDEMCPPELAEAMDRLDDAYGDGSAVRPRAAPADKSWLKHGPEGGDPWAWIEREWLDGGGR
jgi:hypothetical protein